LMRKPVDRRSIVAVMLRSLRVKELAAILAGIFVLMVAIRLSPICKFIKKIHRQNIDLLL
jgi:hypothetical protein